MQTQPSTEIATTSAGGGASAVEVAMFPAHRGPRRCFHPHRARKVALASLTDDDRRRYCKERREQLAYRRTKRIFRIKDKADKLERKRRRLALKRNYETNINFVWRHPYWPVAPLWEGEEDAVDEVDLDIVAKMARLRTSDSIGGATPVDKPTATAATAGAGARAASAGAGAASAGTNLSAVVETAEEVDSPAGTHKTPPATPVTPGSETSHDEDAPGEASAEVGSRDDGDALGEAAAEVAENTPQHPTEETSREPENSSPYVLQATADDLAEFQTFIEKKDIRRLCDEYGFVVVKLDLTWLAEKFNGDAKLEEVVVDLPKLCVNMTNQKVFSSSESRGAFKIENTKNKTPVDLPYFVKRAKKDGKEYQGTMEEMFDALHVDLKKGNVSHIYGQDSDANLVLPKMKVPQVQLTNLSGNELSNLKHGIKGLSTDYAYLGVGGSMFGAHIEDWNLHSLNVHVCGSPKLWYFVEPKSRSKLEEAVAEERQLPTGFRCSQYIRHESLFLSDEFLQRHAIHYRRIQQTPGDLLIISPWAYHQGFNAGGNLAVSNNYAFPDMKEEGFYTANGSKYTNCVKGVCDSIYEPMELEFN